MCLIVPYTYISLTFKDIQLICMFHVPIVHLKSSFENKYLIDLFSWYLLLAFFMLATYLNLLLILNTSPLVYIGLIFFYTFSEVFCFHCCLCVGAVQLDLSLVKKTFNLFFVVFTSWISVPFISMSFYLLRLSLQHPLTQNKINFKREKRRLERKIPSWKL